MRTAPFDYLRAETVDAALGGLAQAEDARVLAGGQSLVPIMAMRLATPGLLVDITRCGELRTYALDQDGLLVGAAVPDRELERDPVVRTGYPLLHRTLSLIAHPEIRARGTLCGSLAHADPAAELPALLLAVDGEVHVRGAAGHRTIPAEDFFTGPFTTALDEGEMIVAARLPVPGPGAGWAVEEVARRRGDFAIVGVVCVLDPAGDGRWARARVSLFGVASTPVRCHAAEAVLVGSRVGAGGRIDDAVLEAAAVACFEDLTVLGDDVHASADYRRTVGRDLVRRALRTAAARSAAGGRP